MIDLDGSVRTVADDVRLTNGLGVSPDVADRIFDPFFTTKTQGGTGLGLAISKRIVQEAGGTISVASEPGEWTRFTVRLPLADGAVSEPQARS